MNSNSLKASILFALTVFLFASCDKDFNGIGTDVIGDDNFEIEKSAESVLAFNQNLGPVQSNNLPVNALGIYNNSAFGTTTANFATQLELATLNPTIDAALNPEIESVILTIPYFVDATKTVLNSNGSHTYELDSIYGPKDSKIKLGVYESGYFMRDLDPATQETQIYYSNQNSLFDNEKGQLLFSNDEFVFSDAELTEVSSDGTTTRSAPGMKLYLDIAFFKSKIIDAPSGKLATNNIFKNYFRGLYFKVEKSGASPSSLALINFKGGSITVKYKENASVTDTDHENRVEKSIVLNLTGNSVNLFQNEYSPTYTDGLASSNNDRLYLKGGEGSMTVIELFGSDDNNNGVADKLEELRANKWLINDASLTFTIDADAMTNANEPNRIYLYDLNNNKQLLDYGTDSSIGLTQKYNKVVHGGIIEKTDGRGVQYKIRLTNHIRNLIKNDTVTNVRLGLVVTENINDVSSKKLETPVFSKKIKQIPTSSVVNPLGTILYGSNLNVPEDKRLKFEIYYTKPN